MIAGQYASFQVLFQREFGKGRLALLQELHFLSNTKVSLFPLMD